MVMRSALVSEEHCWPTNFIEWLRMLDWQPKSSKQCSGYSPWTDESGDTKVAIFDGAVWAWIMSFIKGVEVGIICYLLYTIVEIWTPDLNVSYGACTHAISICAVPSFISTHKVTQSWADFKATTMLPLQHYLCGKNVVVQVKVVKACLLLP